MKTSTILRAGSVAVAALSIATLAYAAALKPDVAKSSISATFKQMNVPVDAKFKRFTAQIDYDAAKPEASKATMELDVPSFDMGEAEYNSEVLKKEWFNAAQFPKATFVSTGMKAGAAGSLNVTGTLTIKGKANTVSFPLTVKKDGNNTVFDGQLPIKRLAYNIGEGEWKDTSTVADDVTIKFHVVTAP